MGDYTAAFYIAWEFGVLACITSKASTEESTKDDLFEHGAQVQEQK